MVKKFAATSSLASATFDNAAESGFKRVARGEDAQDASASEGPRSYYIDGSRKIDIRGILEKVAESFNISKDPADYIYEAIRANTTNVSNENHDAFHKTELLTFDPIKRRAVYQTYIEKPHHLNHDTAITRKARGVIVDAHYNDTSPALDRCPSCDFETREASARDPSGIHCKKCGSTVKDEFVEILVAVDTKKDPYLADAIKTGHARSGSMGCFLPGTPITMADGTRTPIEDIRVGDQVITHTGARAKVEEIFVRKYKDSVYHVEIQGLSSPVVATGNHPFWVVDLKTRKGEWVEADQLDKGQYLRCPNTTKVGREGDALVDGDGLIRKIKAIKAESYSGPVYNFEVGHDDHSYVAGGVAVHNCNCVSTTCNVCQHVAYSVDQFCEHIKRGNKGTFWAREGNQEWRRVEAKALDHEFKKRGRKFVREDFCFAKIEPDLENKTAAVAKPFEVRKAFENCNQVEFDEYSRVDQPADPKANQIEILKTASADDPTPEELEMESRALVLRAQANQLEAKARLRRRAQSMSGDGEDLIVSGEVDLESALHIQTPEGDHLEAPDGSKVVVAPAGEEPLPMDMPPDQVPGQPAPGGIEEVTDQMTNPGLGQPGLQQQQQWEPEALGILPPASGALESRPGRRGKRMEKSSLFTQDYGEFYADVTQEGNALIVSPAGPVMVVTAACELPQESDRRAFGREVLASVLADGLLETFTRYDGTFSPRFAQILDAAVNEMQDYKTRPDKPAIADKMDAMAEGARPKVSGLPDGVNTGGVSELNKERPEMPSGAIADQNMDHKDDRKTDYGQLSMLKDPNQDVAKERTTKSLSNSILDGGHENQKLKHRGAAEDPVLAKYAVNIQKAAALEIEKVKKEAEDRIAKLEADVSAKLQNKLARALRVASRRFALDLEDSPLKLAMFNVLHSKQAVGHDTGTGEDLVIGPLSQELAVTLCQRGWQRGASAEIEALIKRAMELVASDEKYLVDAEADLKNQAVSEPIIATAASLTIDEDETRAQEMRHEASQGNLHLAPSPEVAMEDFGSRRASIREALATRPNKVNMDLASLEGRSTL